MEMFQYTIDWLADHPTITHVLKYIFWVLLIVFFVSILRNIVKKRLPEATIRYKSQKAIEIVGYLLIILLSFSFFTGNIKDFTLAVGLLTAGITITLQELILSVAGSFYIFFVKVYKPGDRIELHGIKGDVIDIDSIYTTMMEIGEWVTSDNYSGRIVKLSNSFVFKGPIYNYSQDFPFVWDEFNLPIKYDSDIELAKSIVVQVASETLSDFVTQSKANWDRIVKKYYIEDAEVKPTLAISMTDNWVQFNLRYIVDYKKRRITKNILHERLRKAIQATDERVKLASVTLEIVNIPNIKIDSQK